MNAIKSIRRATLLSGFVGLAIGSSVAHASGSTDIYGVNGFAASFGAPQRTPAAHPLAGSYYGSTDIYAVNAFKRSFGSDVSGTRTEVACSSGSTDIYGVNGFLVSFGPSASRPATDLAVACQSPKTLLR
jgi:hypothetical protein